MRVPLLDLGAGWCILRTGGPRTLRLAESLGKAGIEAWTPRRTYKRPVPGAKPRLDGVRPMQELDTPILPTFVFVRAVHVGQVEAIERDQANPHIASRHPPFSLWRYHGAVPFIADREIIGLQEEERREAAKIQAMRDADSAEEAKRIRIAALKSEAARRRATRNMEQERRQRLAGERRGAKPGTAVEIDEMPAMAGMTGVVETNDGSIAFVRFGSQSWKIDAWRLSPRVEQSPALRGIAA